MRKAIVLGFFLSLTSSTAFAANTITLGETTADGGLSKDRAVAILQENLPDIVRCLEDDVKVPSSIQIELQLEPDQPIKARVLTASIGNRTKGRCVLDAAQKWPFSVKQRTVVTQKFDVSAAATPDDDSKAPPAKDAKKDAKADAKDAKKDAKADAKDAKADAKDAKKDAKADTKEAKKDAKADAKKDDESDKPAEGDDAKADAAKADDSEEKGKGKGKRGRKKGKDDAEKSDADSKDADDGKTKSDDSAAEEEAEPQGAIRLFREIKLEPTLSIADINAKVGENDGELLTCYMALVAVDKKAAGHLDLKYTIAADGKVTDAEVVKTTTLKNEEFTTCATTAVKKWEFDVGGAVITQRFGFTPTKYFAGKAGLVVNLKSIAGPMDAAAVIKVAVKKQKSLEKCFKASVKGKKAPITIATVDVTIDEKGKASAGEVTVDPEVKKLAGCLSKGLGKLKFSKLKKGQEGETKASFEMIYTPKSSAFKVSAPKFK